MNVTIWLTSGRVRIRRMGADSVMGLLEEWRHGSLPVLTVTLDEEATSDIARAHIVRIDTDPEDTK